MPTEQPQLNQVRWRTREELERVYSESLPRRPIDSSTFNYSTGQWGSTYFNPQTLPRENLRTEYVDPLTGTITYRILDRVRTFYQASSELSNYIVQLNESWDSVFAARKIIENLKGEEKELAEMGCRYGYNSRTFKR